MAQSEGGKGDKRRPLSVSREQYENNWDMIFRKNKDARGDKLEAHQEDNKTGRSRTSST